MVRDNDINMSHRRRLVALGAPRSCACDVATPARPWPTKMITEMIQAQVGELYSETAISMIFKAIPGVYCIHFN